MPYVATLNNNIIYTFDYTEQSFNELKGKTLTCPGCGASMFTKKSKLATRFFAHNSDTDKCFTSNMSPDHLMAQEIIKKAIDSRRGWSGYMEYSQDKWRGDVVAINNKTNEKISFEVQFSPMTITKAEERTTKHLLSGVKQVIWLYGGDLSLPKHMSAAYLLRDSENLSPSSFKVSYSTLPDMTIYSAEGYQNIVVPLASFVKSILDKQLIAKYFKQTGIAGDGVGNIIEIERCLFISSEQMKELGHDSIIADIQKDREELAQKLLEEKEERERFALKEYTNRQNQWQKDRDTISKHITELIAGANLSPVYRDELAGGVEVVIGRNQILLLEPNIIHVSKPYARDILTNDNLVIVFLSQATKDDFTLTYGKKKNVYSYAEFNASNVRERLDRLGLIRKSVTQMSLFQE